ncbi:MULTISPECIES: replication-relaxation family protein [Oceanobacillus]|uniref:Uncharacterized protein n=1 Tax=Oceanobacillus kimchii TaxID=746691 RepID=A0ABQ5TN94_9BACI|nr:replication-relaxation family protein [Oceanobacillus kimchii]GLO68283.1 hypothetical protein MACH08_40670 [Oceanobacillus kimchii]
MEQFHLVNFAHPSLSDNEYFKEKQQVYLPNYPKLYIKVTLFELEILKVLTIHKTLTTTQLLHLHNAHNPKKIKKEALRKKLLRWCEKDVINIYNPSKRNVPLGYNNIYSIGKEGVHILVIKDFLPEEILDEDIADYNKITNHIHSVGQHDVAIELFTKLKEYDLFFDTVRPSSYNNKTDESNYGKSDWLLRYYNEKSNEYTMVYIEFDTGTESIDIINGKINSYIKRAAEHPKENHLVLFSVLDDEFHQSGDKNNPKKRRIGNLKKQFLDSDKRLPTNLKFKIAYRNRMHHIVRREILEIEKTDILDTFTNYLETVMEYQIQSVADEDIYMKEVNKDTFADQIFEVCNKEGVFQERLGVIIADEGDINSFNKVIGFYQNLKDRVFKSSVTRLVLIYEDEESMIDPYSYKFDKSVLLTNYSSLKGQRKMIFNQFINLNGTKKVSYILNQY